MLSIGQISRRTGVKIPTIRFYEHKDLLPEPVRSPGNQQERLRDRIAKLQRLERELGRIATACDGQHDHVCAVLHAFGDHQDCVGEH